MKKQESLIVILVILKYNATDVKASLKLIMLLMFADDYNIS